MAEAEKKQARSSRDEADAFWDVDELLPPRRHPAVFAHDTEAVELEVPAAPSGAPIGTDAAIPPRQQPNDESRQPCLVYEPDNPLIERVSVWRWKLDYTLFNRFRNDAVRYYDREGDAAPREPFFSYMPQYMQLNSAQRAWYFAWRSQVRRGIYPDTDASYVLLYLYELLELSDMIGTEKTLRLLCDIWLAYRERFPRLDRMMTEWVCDYCLIYQLAPPWERLEPILPVILRIASLKEFYLRPERGTDAYAAMLLHFASGYDWRGSRYYTPENALLFDTHIPAAFAAAVKRLGRTDPRFSMEKGMQNHSRLLRSSYADTPCALRRRIDVECLSCTRSSELRMVVSDLVKCAENGVRSLLGVRARLSPRALTPEMKAAVEAYFLPLQKKRAEEEQPAYLKEYEQPSAPLSPESARKIEQRSWSVTNRLVESFAEPEEPSPAPAPEPSPAAETAAPEGDALLYRAAERLLACDSAGFARLAAEHHLLTDTLAERLNEALYDAVGDAVAEDTGTGYALLEDYRDDVEEWINGSAGK